eukprot:5753122-Pleurochrysis_carterae.AAC.1
MHVCRTSKRAPRVHDRVVVRAAEGVVAAEVLRAKHKEARKWKSFGRELPSRRTRLEHTRSAL